MGKDNKASNSNPDEINSKFVDACKNGNIDFVRTQISKGLISKATLSLGLITSLWKNNPTIADFLLNFEKNLNLDYYDSQGNTFVLAATRHPRILDQLISRGADFQATMRPDGFQPIHLAANFGELESIKILFKNGVNLKSEAVYALTPALIAKDEHPSLEKYINITTKKLDQMKKVFILCRKMISISNNRAKCTAFKLCLMDRMKIWISTTQFEQLWKHAMDRSTMKNISETKKIIQSILIS